MANAFLTTLTFVVGAVVSAVALGTHVVPIVLNAIVASRVQKMQSAADWNSLRKMLLAALIVQAWAVVATMFTPGAWAVSVAALALTITAYVLFMRLPQSQDGNPRLIMILTAISAGLSGVSLGLGSWEATQNTWLDGKWEELMSGVEGGWEDIKEYF